MPIIEKLSVQNFSAFHQLEWNDLGSLNVITGLNSTGKTHLLKLLYSIARGIEEGNKTTEVSGNSKSIYILQKILHCIIPQPKGSESFITYGKSEAKLQTTVKAMTLKFLITADQNCSVDSAFWDDHLDIQSTFIPTKEIFSIFDAIVETREGSKRLLAFDDTYYDLVKDFRLPMAQQLTGEKSYPDYFHKMTEGGKIEYIDNQLLFVKDKLKLSMHQTAEGIRKLGIFDRLIRNHRIQFNQGNCVICLDEPETNLHPEAIITFAEMLHDFAQNGVQVFLATHSYFMLKRLEQLAKEHSTDYTMLDLRKDENGRIQAQQSLLRQGLPPNPIIEQSLELYKKDVDLVLGN
jgi:predicted ATP-dependent endonuclease of OLD family